MKICVEVPATSANCCVGFDCLGMALEEMASFHFESSDQLKITGCPEEFQNENNLVVQSFYRTCKAYGKEAPTFKLHIDSKVPAARGLGSSSTCIVAGVMAADLWLNLRMDKDDFLRMATEIEGHPDNVGPAIFGQLCACFMRDKQIIHTQVDCAQYTTLAIIPPYEVNTKEARKVLPTTLPFEDAVKQTGHALVFERAIATGQEELLYEACQDFLHEPYRKELIKEYDEVTQICSSLQLPFWISGSGPTMLIVSKNQGKLRKAEEMLKERFEHCDIRQLEVNTFGALAYYE